MEADLETIGVRRVHKEKKATAATGAEYPNAITIAFICVLRFFVSGSRLL
jgi:hypothetical protein